MTTNTSSPLNRGSENTSTEKDNQTSKKNSGVSIYQQLLISLEKKLKLSKMNLANKAINAVAKTPDDLLRICSYEAGKIEGFKLALVEIERQYALLAKSKRGK